MSPIWLASLTNLKELYPNHATELISLPPLGMISCLEPLTIKFAERLKKVGVEFLGIESENKQERRHKNIPKFEISQMWWFVQVGRMDWRNERRRKRRRRLYYYNATSSKVDNLQLRKLKVVAGFPAYNSIEGIGDLWLSNYHETLPKRDRRGLAQHFSYPNHQIYYFDTVTCSASSSSFILKTNTIN